MWDAVNGIAEMGIPETAATQGGKYFWKEDREVPDMWHVLFDYPKRSWPSPSRAASTTSTSAS